MLQCCGDADVIGRNQCNVCHMFNYAFFVHHQR